MTDQEYTVSAVSTKEPETWSFTKDGQNIELRTFLIKLNGDDATIRLFRGPKSKPPRVGDTFFGSIVDEERGLRLRIKNENTGRTGQRDNPHEIRVNMAVKTAFEAAIVLKLDSTNVEPFVKQWASKIYDMAVQLSEEKGKSRT